MPGRHKRSGVEGAVEVKLTRPQANLAARVLKTLWSPDNGVPSDEDKARIHREINAAFAQAGHTAVYSARKLGDAISNRMYTWRLAQRKKVPQSWAAGARANRRKRNQAGINNTAPEKHKETEEEGMVTPRVTASLIDGCTCDAEMFGLPVVTDDFVCSVEVPAPPTDLEISTVSTIVDDSWNVFATLDSTGVLPSPPTSASPMEGTAPMEPGASMCGTDTTYNMASDYACSTVAPLDDLDLLLKRAEVDINLDGIQLCDIDCVSVEQPLDAPQSVAEPGRTEEPVDYSRPASQFSASAIGFENEFENPKPASGFKTDLSRDGRTSSSEPQRKVQKTAPHAVSRAPEGKANPRTKGKANQALVDAQMAAFERFEAPGFQVATFDATPFQPQRRVLGMLNPQQVPPGSAPAA